MPKKFSIDPYYDSPEWRELRRLVLQRDGGRCRYCGERAHQADHVVPRRRGGPDTLANLVACCKPCNATALNNRFVSFEAKRTWILARRGLVPTEKPPRPVKKRRQQYAPPKVRLTGLRKRLALKYQPEHIKDALLLDRDDSTHLT